MTNHRLIRCCPVDVFHVLADGCPRVFSATTAILEWDPPRHMVLRVYGRLVGSTLVTLDVDRGANGCLAHLTETVLWGPGLLLPGPLRNAGLHLQSGERLDRLARLAETYAAGELPTYPPVVRRRPRFRSSADGKSQ